MNFQNENIEFLEALGNFIVIKKNIIKITEEIIKNSKDINQENRLIEEKITLLINDMNNNNVHINDDDIETFKNGIKSLILHQLPFSKMAIKIRNMKSNPPDIFK